MKHILFLGDSITDCDHCFTPDNLGDGYVKMISDSLSRDSFSVVNGGTDGFTFPSIYRKWRQSYSSHHYDTVSILGGINDTGALMDSGMSESQVQAQILQAGIALRKLLEGLAAQNTARILLAEPFLFPYPDYLSTWMHRLHQIQSMIRQTARAFSMNYIPASDQVKGTPEVRIISLQHALDQIARSQGYPAVTTDGIHLTETGHQIVCECMLPHIFISDTLNGNFLRI